MTAEEWLRLYSASMDARRDVVAMTEAVLLLDVERPRAENAEPLRRLDVLFRNADRDACLRNAVSLLAASWRTGAREYARITGRDEDEVLAEIISRFRKSSLLPPPS